MLVLLLSCHTLYVTLVPVDGSSHHDLTLHLSIPFMKDENGCNVNTNVVFIPGMEAVSLW